MNGKKLGKFFREILKGEVEKLDEAGKEVVNGEVWEYRFKATEEEFEQVQKRLEGILGEMEEREFQVDMGFLRILKRVAKDDYFKLFQREIGDGKAKVSGFGGISEKDFDKVVIDMNESKTVLNINGDEETIDKIM